MDLLTPKELHLANKLMNLALANSAESFAQLAKNDIKLQHAEIQFKPIRYVIDEHIHEENMLYTLSSAIIGDVPAHSYFVLSYADAANLSRVCLSKSDYQNNEMREALLTEIANILTASVVTQLSNFFKVKIFGYVPILKKLNPEDIKSLIMSEMDKDDISFYLKTNFITSNLKIQPDFIWTFNHIFIHIIQNMSKNENNLLLLTQQDDYMKQYII
ncbi:MAG: chemotaxis protein CheC [Thermoflexibacter sp.]|jgi:chemotaxis protein CheY-P-specific phosphatase CheC|nr:chemotaxis protein CheC [Thermoflexibacter sp.]